MQINIDRLLVLSPPHSFFNLIFTLHPSLIGGNDTLFSIGANRDVPRFDACGLKRSHPHATTSVRMEPLINLTWQKVAHLRPRPREEPSSLPLHRMFKEFAKQLLLALPPAFLAPLRDGSGVQGLVGAPLSGRVVLPSFIFFFFFFPQLGLYCPVMSAGSLTGRLRRAEDPVTADIKVILRFDVPPGSRLTDQLHWVLRAPTSRPLEGHEGCYLRRVRCPCGALLSGDSIRIFFCSGRIPTSQLILPITPTRSITIVSSTRRPDFLKSAALQRLMGHTFYGRMWTLAFIDHPQDVTTMPHAC